MSSFTQRTPRTLARENAASTMGGSLPCRSISTSRVLPPSAGTTCAAIQRPSGDVRKSCTLPSSKKAWTGGGPVGFGGACAGTVLAVAAMVTAKQSVLSNFIIVLHRMKTVPHAQTVRVAVPAC